MYSIEEMYAEKNDMTFIVLEEYNEEDKLISETVIGFYHGEPKDEITKSFLYSLKAEYMR